MDVRIGIIQTAKELDVELGDDVDGSKIVSDVEAALGQVDGVLWLTDKRGRRVAVPASKIAYIELGATGDARRVGFGTS